MIKTTHTAQKIGGRRDKHRAPSRAHAKHEVCLSTSMPAECEAQEWWFDVRPKFVGKRRPRPIDELLSESSESTSTSDATTARWCEASETRAAASQSNRQSEKVVRVPTRRAEGKSHRSRSKCGSAGHRRFAQTSRDVRDAEGRVVGRKHKCVHRRMTGQCPETGESPGRRCHRRPKYCSGQDSDIT